MSEFTPKQLIDAARRAEAAGDTAAAERLKNKARELINVPREAPSPLSGLPEGSALEKASNPAMGMSGPERFAAGLEKGVRDIGVGLSQIYGGEQSLFAKPLNFPTQAEIEQRRERDKSLMSTGLGMTGNVVGSSLPFLPAMAAPALNTVRGAALMGGVAGAVQPTAGNESRLANTAIGAALGGGITAALKGAGNVMRKGRDIVQSYTNPAYAAGRALDDAAGPRRQAIIDALRANRTPNISAGEAAAPAGSAEFSALQGVADEVNPSGFFARRSAQAAARSQRLRDVLKTDKLDDFISARESAVGPLYEAADESVTKVKVDELSNMLDELIDKNKNRSGVANVLRDIKSKLPKPRVEELEFDFMNPDAVAPPAEIPGQSVADMRMLLKHVQDLMSSKPPTGVPLNDSVIRELIPVKNALNDAIAAASDDYAKAVASYAELSQPVNQAELGRVLRESLDSPITDMGAEMGQRSASYASAIRNAERTAKEATGFARTTIEEIATPAQMQAIREVGEELANLSNYEKLSRLGSKAGREIVADISPSKLPGILERNVVIANSILGRSGKTATKRILEYLAANMDNPQTIAEIMEKASPEVGRQVREIWTLLRQGASLTTAQAGTEHG